VTDRRRVRERAIEDWDAPLVAATRPEEESFFWREF